MFAVGCGLSPLGLGSCGVMVDRCHGAFVVLAVIGGAYFAADVFAVPLSHLAYAALVANSAGGDRDEESTVMFVSAKRWS
jgi:hypothetical protein